MRGGILTCAVGRVAGSAADGSGRRIGLGGVPLDEFVNGVLVGRRDGVELEAERRLRGPVPDNAGRGLDVA